MINQIINASDDGKIVSILSYLHESVDRFVVNELNNVNVTITLI